MLYQIAALKLLAFIHFAEAVHSRRSVEFSPKGDPCTPLAQGWEAIDDTPAINAAILACGNGGIITLPTDQVYSIRTPIDFTPCRSCDFQIEGTLIVARDLWNYWNREDTASIWRMDGVKGVRIRSVTGSGLVDGNAIEYYLTPDDGTYPRNYRKALLDIKNGSSDVSIENLTFKNVMHRFFNAREQSTNITLSNLHLMLERKWGLYPKNEYDATGVDLGHVSNVKISNIKMNFKANYPSLTAGICISMDVGAHNIDIRNVNCTGAWGGALVHLKSDSINLTAHDSADSVSNIYVSDFTFSGDTATEFKSWWADSTMKNITWDGVNIINGNPAAGDLCYGTSGLTGYNAFCREHIVSSVTEVWFKRFRGKLSGIPDNKDWAINNQTVTEYHFEDWQNTEM